MKNRNKTKEEVLQELSKLKLPTKIRLVAGVELAVKFLKLLDPNGCNSFNNNFTKELTICGFERVHLVANNEDGNNWGIKILDISDDLKIKDIYKDIILVKSIESFIYEAVSGENVQEARQALNNVLNGLDYYSTVTEIK